MCIHLKIKYKSCCDFEMQRLFLNPYTCWIALSEIGNTGRETLGEITAKYFGSTLKIWLVLIYSIL